MLVEANCRTFILSFIDLFKLLLFPTFIGFLLHKCTMTTVHGSSPEIRPSLVFVFSGKRKSGKDFVCSHLKDGIGTERCTILTLSAPLKQQYAEIHNLDYEQLLTASSYKERYRKDMVVWGENKRKEDPSIFCRLATSNVNPQYKVWLISDARRQSDVKYFRETYAERAVLVRVQADMLVRETRGFVFKEGVDDSVTECGLDTGVAWDHVIVNNGGGEELNTQLAELQRRAESALAREPSEAVLS